MQLTPQALQKIKEFAPYAELMPGIIIIHNAVNLNVVHMCNKGLNELGITLNELINLKAEYYSRFFNMDEVNEAVPKIMQLLNTKDPTDSITYLQQVKLKHKTNWSWYISSTRVLLKDGVGKPVLLVTSAVPLDEVKHIEAKANKIIQHKDFHKNHSERFSMLSCREKLILKNVAQGKSSPEIADELFISIGTVQTHRRNIKRKLNISSVYEFTEYALAYDLI